MNPEPKILSMLKEAQLYRQQGLLEETLQQYRKIEKTIRGHKTAKNKEALLEKVLKKKQAVEKEFHVYLESREIPEVSDKVRKLMRSMFSLDDPEVKGSSLLGEAIALAGFGQYDAAVEALERLLDIESLRLDAAKKLIAYTLEFKGKQKAIGMIRKLEADNRFSMEDRNNLIKYLQEQLKITDVGKNPALKQMQEPDSEISDSDVFDISAIRLKKTESQGKKDNRQKLNIIFQHGTKINIIVPRDQKDLSSVFQTGRTVEGVVCYSTMGTFSSTMYVLLNRTIDFGPHNGDASINLKILNIIT